MDKNGGIMPWTMLWYYLGQCWWYIMLDNVGGTSCWTVLVVYYHRQCHKHLTYKLKNESLTDTAQLCFVCLHEKLGLLLLMPYTPTLSDRFLKALTHLMICLFECQSLSSLPPAVLCPMGTFRWIASHCLNLRWYLLWFVLYRNLTVTLEVSFLGYFSWEQICFRDNSGSPVCPSSTHLCPSRFPSKLAVTWGFCCFFFWLEFPFGV